MQNPEIVLGIIESNTKKPSYVFSKLYRNFYNLAFYKMAYNKLYAQQRKRKYGADDKKRNKLDFTVIQTNILSMKNETYKPVPFAKKEKRDGKNMADYLNQYDTLVVEIVKSMLEAIYKPTFSKLAHPFQPKKHSHDALIQVKTSFVDTKWWIKGKLHSPQESKHYHVLVSILRKKIKDEKFIRLIWKLLKAGYWNEKYLLFKPGERKYRNALYAIFNEIYYHELDRKMQDIIYSLSLVSLSNKKIERNASVAKISNVPSKEGKTKYVRYGNDFLVGVVGSKKDAQMWREAMTQYIKEALKLELTEEAISIINQKEKVRFLEYDLFLSTRTKKRQFAFHDGMHQDELQKEQTSVVKLSLPHDQLRKFIIGNGYAKDTGKGHWKAIHRSAILNKEPLEIVRCFNAELTKFYRYYGLADDVKQKLQNVYVLWLQSFTKTLAGKYRTKTSKLKEMEMEAYGNKYKRFFQHGDWGVSYERHGQICFERLCHYSDISPVNKNRESSIR
ncbi:reverse transcriptase/maturase family protein [Massilibacterium senegalense]|uniref:reverse transcriptase/maturase family protein n=1 Tax=Massilibacterium senegalense TaxID=1632858 RepID=UPI000784C2BE|nr:reverse transcriptase/maturase family protein [Massilibacterium senegalense]